MRNLLYLGNVLSKKGYNLTYIEILGPLLEREDFNLVYASDKKNQLLRLLDMILKTLINIRRVDYIIIDTYSTTSFYYALITSQICRFFNKKYIPILHGGNLPFRLKSSPFLSDLIFKNAHFLVAPSGYLENSFKTKYSKNLIYIPNTIQIKKYPFYKRQTIEPKLLWVRSFSKIYNPLMAVKVLSKLKNEFPNATLCMVGPEKDNSIHECKLFAKKMNVEVIFTGKLNKEDWIELSKKYAIFINTTHFDNTPVSVIEAMALGLPVVSTNVGGIPFLLKNNENAFLVNDNNIDEMVFAIKELCENKEINNVMIANARAVVEEFDWDSVKHKWIEILK